MGGSFLGGLLVAGSVRPGSRLAFAIGLLGVLCLAAAWRLQARRPEPESGQLIPRLGGVGILLVVIGSSSLGFSDLGTRSAILAKSSLPKLEGKVVNLRGRLATDIQPLGRSWSFVIRSVTGDAGRFTGRVAVGAPVRPRGIGPGDLVEMQVKISRLDPNDPFDRMQARKGIVAGALLLEPATLIETTRNPLVNASNLFRDRMLSAAGAALSRNQAGLLAGLVIGDERGISSRVRNDFRASGLSHLTAVSGANLAMVLAALAGILSALRAPRRLSIVLGLMAIVLFTAIARWEPSVLRAAVMASVALAAFLFGRLSSPGHALGLALVGLLAFDPMMLWSAGFQLSFAATAGILWLRPPLIARMGPAPRWVSEPLAIAIAAQVAVFPLIALNFGRISLAAVPANLAAFGLVAPVTVLGLAGGLAAIVSADLAWPFMKLSGLLVDALAGLARIFGRSQLSQVAVPGFRFAQMVTAYLLIGGVWLLLVGRRRWARWPAVAATVLMIGASLVPVARGFLPENLRITFFDVGQGDAALIESARGARVLIDAGRDPELIAATLKRRGIDRLDVVVASHMQADHVAGLEAVLERINVGMALNPGIRAPANDGLAGTSSRTARMRPVTGGERITVGDTTLEFLGPSAEARSLANVKGQSRAGNEGPELNNASVVLRVVWGSGCALFTGDLEEGGQQEIIDRAPRSLDCTLLKAPHHGSASLLPEFVRAVDPEWVTVSVGPNSYGLPTGKAISIFRLAGARVLRTDRTGDIVMEMDRRGGVKVAG